MNKVLGIAIGAGTMAVAGFIISMNVSFYNGMVDGLSSLFGVAAENHAAMRLDSSDAAVQVGERLVMLTGAGIDEDKLRSMVEQSGLFYVNGVVEEDDGSLRWFLHAKDSIAPGDLEDLGHRLGIDDGVIEITYGTDVADDVDGANDANGANDVTDAGADTVANGDAVGGGSVTVGDG